MHATRTENSTRSIRTRLGLLSLTALPRPEVQADRDPVGALTGDVASVDQVEIDRFDRVVTQPELDARIALLRPDDRKNLAEQAKWFLELPSEARTASQEMLALARIVLPASIEIHAQGFAEVV